MQTFTSGEEICFLRMWVGFPRKCCVCCFSDGREQQIPRIETRSLSLATVFDGSAAPVGTFITKLIALLQPRERWEGEISQTTSRNKRSDPPSSPKSVKDVLQQLNIVYYFWVCFRTGAEIRSYPSWLLSAT